MDLTTHDFHHPAKAGLVPLVTGKEKTMKTIKFTATIGVVAGYGHDNTTSTAAAEIVSAEWQKAAAEIMESTGLYISAVVVDSRTVYHTDWGCPVGGELTATATGSANPAFVQDMDQWKKAVIAVVKLVKARLQQSTVAVEFEEVSSFVYLTDED